jgi:predicted dehydrogenase
MKIKRRDFLGSAGVAGLSLAGCGISNDSISESEKSHGPDLDQVVKDYQKSHIQRFNMAGYSAPKLEKVRIGIIGLGQRGPSHMKTMGRIENVEIKALCDLRPEKTKEAIKGLEGSSHNPTLYSGNENEWKKVCERDDIDLVIITTPWYMHTNMAVYAMENGKHAASEVPAASTVEEAWQLVETSERTRKHCMMLGNTCYMEFQLLTLNMARHGVFGELVHGDCAYRANKMGNNFNKKKYWDMWWLKQYANRKGNIYPTHGLGPICQMMDINRGDKLEYLVSVESNDFGMLKKSRELAATDEFFQPYVKKDFRGNMNSTLIRTTGGRTIMVQHDATTPSPHTFIHGIYGTEGSALMDPDPPRLSTGGDWASPEEFASLKKKYTPEIYKKMKALAKQSGHGGSDLLIDWHLIDCLRNGLPLAQDVYDAATWSVILPLSEWSVNNRSNSIDIPDFTAGEWKNNQRNMDISLVKGGNTKVLA